MLLVRIKGVLSGRPPVARQYAARLTPQPRRAAAPATPRDRGSIFDRRKGAIFGCSYVKHDIGDGAGMAMAEDVLRSAGGSASRR